MSEQETLPEKKQDNAAEAQDSEQDAAASVKRGGKVVLLVIVASFVWYLAADRFTPYTDQARVEGFVVGVAPKVGGLVTQVWVGNDQQVEEGQRLFEIDPEQYQIAANRARSDLANARNQVSAGTAAVEAARAKLRAAQANELKASQDNSRLQRLYEEDPGTISLRRIEISQASLDQARAQVTAAEADIRRAIESKGGEDDEENAILKTAYAALEKAELDLANTVVKAPSQGMITDLRTDVGLFAGAGSSVMTLIPINDVWINAEFTENNLGNMRVGSDVEILFDVLPGNVFKGRVRSVGRGVSAGRTARPGTLPTIQNSRDWLRQAQRFPVVVEIDDEHHAEVLEHLRVGGQASVIVYTEGHGFLGLLGRIYVRVMSVLSYLY